MCNLERCVCWVWSDEEACEGCVIWRDVRCGSVLTSRFHSTPSGLPRISC